MSSSLNGFTVSRLIPKTPSRRCGVVNGTRTPEPSRIFSAHALNCGNRSSVFQSAVCCGSPLAIACHIGNSSIGRSGKGKDPLPQTRYSISLEFSLNTVR